jgi:hypothetical protein
VLDRSSYFDELKRNPALMRRIAVIVNGEVGSNAPLETKILNAETIFNRAASRGQSLEQVTKQYTGKGSDGYYPSTTFSNGERIISRGNTLPQFYEQVLKPVVNGSDISTSKLGFAATGNASDQPGNTVASNGIRNGYYPKYKWVGNEVYVQHKPDNIPRLEGTRFDRPPGAVADTDPAGRLIPNAATPTAYGPSGQPAAPAARAIATAAPQRPALGDQIARAMGSRGIGMPGYLDPNTGHQIINPAGSGEQAMGLTRDVGRPSFARQSSLSPFAQPAPAPPPRPVSPSPPDARTATTGIPAGPVSQRTTVPDVLAPLTGQPRAPSAGLSPFDPTMFDVKQIGQQRGGTDFLSLGPKIDTSRVGMPWDDPAAMALHATAPPEAAMLAMPNPVPRAIPQQGTAFDPPASSFGGNSQAMPLTSPTTVDQQLRGMSPFSNQPPQPSQFASTTLLPFQQWPPVGWGGDYGGFAGWGGPASFDFGAFG